MPQRRSQNLNGKGSKGKSGRKIGGDGSSLMGPSGRKGKGKGKGAQPTGSRSGHGAFNTDGYPVQKGGAEFESDIFGGNSYYREADGQTYHGQEAIDMYEQDHPGEGGPHDGITGESGMYWGDSSWNPSEGGGGGQGDEMEDDDRWGAGQSRAWSR